jgi:NAD(P)-dependent dehydrogenase (short-subunit alcohol dehydrogenase family)
MAKTKKLQGKVAVITGGTTGIGFAAAKLFVKEGAYVFITGRRQKELDEAVKAIGSNVTGILGDIANLTDLDRLYEAVAIKGRIDVVFANAGVAEFAPLDKITEEHFDRLFDVNVKGTLFTVQKSLPLMNDGGSIILNGSVASVKGTPAFGVYGATKAALRSFVRTWTSDLKDRHIRSNVVSPGRLSMGNLQTPLHGLCPPSQWDAWENPMKLPKRRCFWPRMTPVSSRVSSCLLMAAEGKSDRRTPHRIPCLVAFRRDALEGLPPCSRFRAIETHPIQCEPATSLPRER